MMGKYTWAILTVLVSCQLHRDLTAKGLTGTLPADFSILTDIDFMYLAENDLSGSLPPSWSVLTKLRYL